MNTKDHQRGPNVHFYRVGIGSKTTVNSLGWQLMPLIELTRKYNETNVRILFSANVNSRSRSLYVVVRPSVVCL